MEQIKRANRLYTSDTIFLKPTLLIPRRLGPEEEEKEEEEEGDAGPGAVLVSPATSRHELSAADFLRQIDAEICLSKAAATRRLCESNTRCGATFQVPEGDGGRKGTALRRCVSELGVTPKGWWWGWASGAGAEAWSGSRRSIVTAGSSVETCGWPWRMGSDLQCGHS
nr:PREDICTED: lysM and putative peptidoglycan-binding domain-containing protein 1 isoform X2 [Struthio camelus australis]